MYDFRHDEVPGTRVLMRAIAQFVDEKIISEDKVCRKRKRERGERRGRDHHLLTHQLLLPRQAFQDLGEDQDVTLKEYLDRVNAPRVMYDLLDATICNDWCSSVGRTALRELLSCEANKAGLTIDAAWRFGTSEIFPIAGLMPFVRHLARDVPIYCGAFLRRGKRRRGKKRFDGMLYLQLSPHQATKSAACGTMAKRASRRRPRALTARSTSTAGT